MTPRTGFLEETPGVRSMARLVAFLFALAGLALVAASIAIGLHVLSLGAEDAAIAAQLAPIVEALFKFGSTCIAGGSVALLTRKGGD